MSLVLHMGVIDIPYAEAPKKHQRHKSATPVSGTQTTGDVAEILEAEYHIMQIFFEVHHAQIEEVLLESIGDEATNVGMGKAPGSNAFAYAEGRIAEMFRDFITTREIEKLGYPGVPTKAAIDGVNHRLAHPDAKGNPRRPSFVDTGLYVASFRAWMET